MSSRKWKLLRASDLPVPTTPKCWILQREIEDEKNEFLDSYLHMGCRGVFWVLADNFNLASEKIKRMRSLDSTGLPTSGST